MSAGKGKKFKSFIVHESFATKSSKYIQSALKNEWKEGKEKHVSLEDHSPKTLEGYINWLYTKETTLNNAERKCKYHGPDTYQDAQDSDCIYMHGLDLVKMYILGDYLNDMRFCNAVIDTMDLMEGCVINLDAIDWVWSNTMQNNPLTLFLLEHWAEAVESDSQGTIDYMKDGFYRIPDEFLLDLLAFTGTQLCAATARLAEVKKPLAKKSQQCKFHKHIDDSDKCF